MYKKHFACRESQQHNDLGKDEVSFQNYRHVEKKNHFFVENVWEKPLEISIWPTNFSSNHPYFFSITSKMLK